MCMCVCVCTQLNERFGSRKYRMQKTKKQIVNHLLACFLHAQKAGDATRAKRDGDIPTQSCRNYNYFTAKAHRKKQLRGAIKFSELRVRIAPHLIIIMAAKI